MLLPISFGADYDGGGALVSSASAQTKTPVKDCMNGGLVRIETRKLARTGVEPRRH
jgi:hypothetical protein